MNFQLHQIQYAIHLLQNGLLDADTRLVVPELVEAALSAMAARPRDPTKPLTTPIIDALRMLAGRERAAEMLDGRTRNALIARGFAETFDCADLGRVRVANDKPTLTWGHGGPSAVLIRITPAGRGTIPRAALQGATMSPCPPTTNADPR